MKQIQDSKAYLEEKKRKLEEENNSSELSYIPPQVITFQNLENDLAVDTNEEQEGSAVATLGSVGVEVGGGIAASYKLKTGKNYLNALKAAQYSIATLRGVQAANTASSVKALTPWGALAQVGIWGTAEAGIWMTSNFLGQKIRQAYGVTDQHYASETMSSALFAVVAAPVEKAIQTSKVVKSIAGFNKKPAYGLNQGLVDMKAWKGRELLLKGKQTFISGAVLGLTESAFRQEIALMLNERENRDVMDYLFSASAGGVTNSVLSVWAKHGAWGRQKEEEMYTRVHKNISNKLSELDDQLKVKPSNVKDRRALASIKKRLRKERNELSTSLNIVEDMQGSIKATHEKVELDAGKQKTDPEITTPEPLPELQAKPTDIETVLEDVDVKTLSSKNVDTVIEDFEKVYQDAVQTGNESVVAPKLTDKLARIYDVADNTMENILTQFGNKPSDVANVKPKQIEDLLDAVEVQTKLLNGIYGRTNALGGRIVQQNNTRVSASANSTFSEATEKTLESLRILKQKLQKRQGVVDDEFVVAAKDFVKKGDDELTSKTEGIDSKQPVDSVEDVSKAAQNKIDNLQEELDGFKKTLKAKTPLDISKSLNKQRTKIDNLRAKELKQSLAKAKKVQKEADLIKELEKEVERLNKVSERNVVSEIEGEVKPNQKGATKPTNPEVEKLKGEILDAKASFRKTLKKIADDGKKQDLLKANAELYEDIFRYVANEAEMEAINPFVRGLRTARMLRKLSMVNQMTSAQAAVLTGAYHLFELLPKMGASKLLDTKLAKKMGIGNKTSEKLAVADVEAFREAFSHFIKPDNLKQLGLHMKRAYQTGQDPNIRSATRFDDETRITQNIIPTGTRRIMLDAAANAREAALGKEAVTKWVEKRLQLGKHIDFLKIMTMGARAITATDAGAKRVLRYAEARAMVTKEAILKNPNDFKKEADRLLKEREIEMNGLRILDDHADFADGFREIDENLLMASRTDNLQDVAESFTETILIKPINKLIKDNSTRKGLLYGTVIEHYAPFYTVGVRGVRKMVTKANPARVLGLYDNPYQEIKKGLEQERDHFKLTIKNRLRAGLDEEAKRLAPQIKNLDERIAIAETRRVRYNKNVLTDVIVQLSLGNLALLAGYAGLSRGSDAWQTSDQKRKNINAEQYNLFGLDYRSAVPINGMLSVASDIGTLIKATEEGQVSNKMGNVQIALQSIANTAQDLPVTQGITDVQSVFRKNHDFEATISEGIASYVPTPAEAKKIVRKITNGDTMTDLRGGKFTDRLVYQLFGIAPPNRQLDILGQYRENNKTWYSVFIRYAGRKQIEYDIYEEIIASDHNQVLPTKLPTEWQKLPVGQDMLDFIDEDGLTLHQHFGLYMQDTDVIEKVNEFIMGDSFVDNFGLTVDDGESSKDIALMGLNSLIRTYYSLAKFNMERDEDFLSRFVNKKDENLLTLMKEKKSIKESSPPTPIIKRTLKDLLKF